MIYFKTFDKQLSIEKGTVIGSTELNNKGIKIFKNPIFVINPSKGENIHIVIPKTNVTNSNGDSVFCKLIEVGEKITVKDMITLDIDIDYKIILVRRIFDKDIQKRYDLFNHIYGTDTTGELLFKFAKNFPDAINKDLMYKLISDRDKTGSYTAKFTVLYKGYGRSDSYKLALDNKNYQAIVHMAVNGYHKGLVKLQSELISNCNDIVTLKEFLNYVKTTKKEETYLLEKKIYYLSKLYEESVV